MKIKSIKVNYLEECKQYYDVINANPYNNFAIKSNSGVIWSHNCFFDEISFIPNQDVEKQKQRALDLLNTAIGGMKTRFNIRGKNPSLLILASSKRSEQSFLEQHMRLKAQTEGANTKIVDEPVWNVRPSTDYSGKTFYVAQGNKFLASEIISDGSNLSEWKNKGYRVLEVPIEYKSNFEEDIDRALCDFAGISASDLTKYISGPRLLATKHREIENPFVKEIIEVGNSRDDSAQYYDFFDIEKVNKKLRYKPLFIHLDMSLSGDKTGIGGVFILGKKPGLGTETNSKELYYQEAFHVAIKAPKGYQVSFAKNREFIYWLKKQGFNIKGVSSDTFQNAELGQDLISKGYKYEVISVDRVNTDKICEPYSYFKNCIYEQRILLPYECDLLTEEIVNLERNGNSGKVDHPDGMSKDCSDAICGSIWNASRHADEYNFEYGEDIESMYDTTLSEDSSKKEQIILDFEEELKNAVNYNNKTNNSVNLFKNFGAGAATTNFTPIGFNSGIVIL